ncbi:SsrA-binding protein SmpB [Alphaproteobacteria bacterium endosymbiont of Tiliacea citrago]|uniref:SsrA-binding protein SmpB n=1 Tax=Alphaproteobacteria bacterium endosymbiont of Tiliacea citrago TaxID=3077944 RepID=UPI00313BBCD8
MKILNRKAKFEYEILEKFEFGIVLLSSEIKAIREGKLSFNDSYLGYKIPHLWIYNLHIGNYKNLEHENKRDRIILLKRKERNKIISKIQKKGLTLVPLELFFNKRGYAKLLCGLGQGKKLYDKRQTIKERDQKKEKESLLKQISK